MPRFNIKHQGSNTGNAYAHVLGSNTGVKVMAHTTVSGGEEFHVYVTDGRAGSTHDRMIGVLVADGRFFAEDGNVPQRADER